MSEHYERTFVGKVQRVERGGDGPEDHYFYLTIEQGNRWQTFRFLGDGSEWTPGQRVDVILRAVRESPKTEEEQDAD